AILDPSYNLKTIFYAHEVATVRRIVEEYPGHDTMFNDLLKQAQKEDIEKLFKILCQEEAKHKLALETLYDDFMAKMGD
ncbi:hypothetical protein LCGC14_2849370, partial [marine sediment metagenome]